MNDNFNIKREKFLNSITINDISKDLKLLNTVLNDINLLKSMSTIDLKNLNKEIKIKQEFLDKKLQNLKIQYIEEKSK